MSFLHLVECVQIMSEKVPLLDKGHVRVIQHMGSDEIICKAARQSTDGAFRGWGDVTTPGDEKFLKYLWTNKHTVPFEHTAVTFEVKAPIETLEQWYTHRTQSRSRMSGRYAIIPDDDYLPGKERLMLPQEGKNTQANRKKGSPALTDAQAIRWLKRLEEGQKLMQSIYQDGLEIGVPKEIARGANTVFRYSQMWVTANLLNWCRFLALRNESHAQLEIQLYAKVLNDKLGEIFPRTMEIFNT